MKRTFQQRELFTLAVCGLRLQGTYHSPDPDKHSQTGILLLTGLATPRAAHGDSGVYWAESFAECGYPSFRVDLPGSGDSEEGSYPGSLPLINGGSHGPVIAAIVEQLVQQYELTGVVIMGHCAGAISALFGAADSKYCRGLILLAPYFHLPQAMGLKARRSLITWATQNRFGALLSRLYHKTNYLRRVSRGHKPPKNTNFPLLNRWKQLNNAGMPILAVKVLAPRTSGAQAEDGGFDYLAYLGRLAAGKHRLGLAMIEGAHHTFANRAGRSGVREQVERWLGACFPVRDTARYPQGASVATEVSETAQHSQREPALAQVDL